MKKAFSNIMKPGRPGLLLLIVIVLILPLSNLHGQGSFMLYKHREKQQQLNVNGSLQLWARHTSLNPGSLVYQEQRSSLLDLSLRRYRLNFSGQASEKLRFYFSIGNNNLNYYSRKQFRLRQDYLQVLDAYADYQLNEYVGIGLGKTAWTGLSRYSAPSTTQALALDINFASIPFIELYDDLLRRPALYIRGRYEKLDYRLALARPLHKLPEAARGIGENAGFSDLRPPYQLSTYIKYQFLEKENPHSPFSAGTYLGKKNILNMGVGALHQPQTSWRLQAADTIYEAATSFAVDVFFDRALAKNSSFTIYAAFFYHYLGKNFIRNIGVNNAATGSIASNYLNSRGNSAPLVGSGNIFYLQTGYLVPANQNNSRQLQPFFTCQYGQLQALDHAAIIYETGFNYYLNSQRSKISFGYQNRPVFIRHEHSSRKETRKGMAVLQYQLILGG